jgi:hypothetical protein
MNNYPKRLADPASLKPSRLVNNPQQEDSARAYGLTQEVPIPEKVTPETYIPIPIIPDIPVSFAIGDRQPSTSPEHLQQWPKRLKTSTGVIKERDTVISVLSRLGLQTDGGVVLLRPGSNFPFQMDEQPYSEVCAGLVLSVVPNRPDQVGPTAAPSATHHLLNVYGSTYPKPMYHPGKPSITVENQADERQALADGFRSVAPKVDAPVPDPKPEPVKPVKPSDPAIPAAG